MNVEKMRRYAARRHEVSEAREHRAWLASMTPEHRAKHEQFGKVCPECLNRSLAAFGRLMHRTSTTWDAHE